jgi:hypothetical protein
MAFPKRKTNISVYTGKELTERRQELLNDITKSDTFLPDSILHDDLDRGFLDYIKKNFNVVSEGVRIPVIDKIMTIQRWGEFSNNWEFVDEDGNIQIPFVSIVRKPEVQLGTNPSVQRTIPDRHQFFYHSVPTWNGTQMGADVYKIPQPIPVDITYEVYSVCNKFRDINKFSKIVLQHFSSRQDYTTVKGHYIPIVLDRIEDSTPMDNLEGRRFYIQKYTFTMLGFLIDSEEFEVKPAVSRFFLMNEFAKEGAGRKKYVSKVIDLTIASFTGDGMQTQFSVGESIGTLFSVTINGLLQQRDVDYFHVVYTSKITFPTPPLEGSNIVITYYKGRNSVIIDNYGKLIQVTTEYFTYDGSSLSFNTANSINSVVTLDINGLVEEEGEGFDISGQQTVTLLGTPVLGSTIGITYLY